MSSGSSNDRGDLAYVIGRVKRVESSVRQKILETGTDSATATTTDTQIEIVNFTHLHGMCGDKVIGVNIKFGAVYYHIYILDESEDPELVKILGPKEVSVEVTGFR